nr:hypothetical protein [Tanacetum cinerariifolium]
MHITKKTVVPNNSADTMADVNVNALADQAPTMTPPTRTDDQIMPHIRWVPIGKRNCYLDVEKSQSNPIYKIAVDILKDTNFFRAFTGTCPMSQLMTTNTAEYQAWTTTDTRLRPFISMTPANLQMNDDMAPDAQAKSYDDEDIGNAYIPNVNLRQDWWKQLEEE